MYPTFLLLRTYMLWFMAYCVKHFLCSFNRENSTYFLSSTDWMIFFEYNDRCKWLLASFDCFPFSCPSRKCAQFHFFHTTWNRYTSISRLPGCGLREKGANVRLILSIWPHGHMGAMEPKTVIMAPEAFCSTVLWFSRVHILSIH
jgi:hypothetical protein